MKGRERRDPDDARDRGDADRRAGERPEPIEERPPGAHPGAEVLRGGSTRDVLRRLYEHDPFDVETRCIAHLDERRLLLDLSRLYTHSLAFIAHDAPDYEGAEPLDAWLSGRITRAIELLLEVDREDESDALPIVPPLEPRYLLLADAVGIEPGLGRRACILFNSLPDDERQAFWAVQVDGRSIEDLVADGHGPAELARRRLRKVVQLLSSVGDAELPDWEGDGSDGD
jgi:hypothetical protein